MPVRGTPIGRPARSPRDCDYLLWETGAWIASADLAREGPASSEAKWRAASVLRRGWIPGAWAFLSRCLRARAAPRATPGRQVDGPPALGRDVRSRRVSRAGLCRPR